MCGGGGGQRSQVIRGTKPRNPKAGVEGEVGPPMRTPRFQHRVEDSTHEGNPKNPSPKPLGLNPKPDSSTVWVEKGHIAQAVLNFWLVPSNPSISLGAVAPGDNRGTERGEEDRETAASWRSAVCLKVTFSLESGRGPRCLTCALPASLRKESLKAYRETLLPYLVL